MQKLNIQKILSGTNILNRLCVGLLVALIAAMFINVILRFGFSTGFLKLQDFQSYIFAVLVLFAIAVSYLGNKQVRAGLYSDETKSETRPDTSMWLELFLGLFSFSVIFVYSLPGVISSWMVFEGSTEPGGLGGYFLVRTALSVMCLLIVMFLLRKLGSLRRGVV